jgi:acyl-CoA reductase-like NAD-dependent aldehyde dehydrogenase
MKIKEKQSCKSLAAALAAELAVQNDIGYEDYVTQHDWTARKAILKPLIMDVIKDIRAAQWSPRLQRRYEIPKKYAALLTPRQRQLLAIQTAYEEMSEAIWEALPNEQEYIHEFVRDYLPIDYPGTDWRGIVARSPTVIDGRPVNASLWLTGEMPCC